MSKNPLNAMVIGNVQAFKGYKVELDAVLDQTNPVANTLYTILNTKQNARIRSVAAQVTWTVQPNPLEVILLIDGLTHIFSVQNPVSGTPYIMAESVASLILSETEGILATTLSATVTFARIIEGRSIAVQARTGSTTAGTVQNLYGRVKYSRIP